MTNKKESDLGEVKAEALLSCGNKIAYRERHQHSMELESGSDKD